MKPTSTKFWSSALLCSVMSLSFAHAQGNGVGNGGEVEVGAKFASIANHIRVLFNTTDLKDVIGKEYSLDTLLSNLQVRRSNTALMDTDGSPTPFLNQQKGNLPYSLVNGKIWSEMNCKSRNYLVIRSLLKHLKVEKGYSYFKTEQVYQYLNTRKQIECDGIAAPETENADSYQREIPAEFFNLASKLTHLDITKNLIPLLNKLQVKVAKNLTSPDHYPVDGWSSIENGVPYTRIDGSRWKAMDCRDRFFLTLHELYVNLKVERSLSYDKSGPAIERLQKQNLLNCSFNATASLGNGTRTFQPGLPINLSREVYALDIPGLVYDRTAFASILKSGGSAASMVPVSITHEGLTALLAQAKMKGVDYYKSVTIELDSSMYAQGQSTWWYMNFDTKTLAATYTTHGRDDGAAGKAELGQFLQSKAGPVTVKITGNSKVWAQNDVYSGSFVAQTSPIQLEIPTELKFTPEMVSRVQLLRDFVPDASASFLEACAVDWVDGAGSALSGWNRDQARERIRPWLNALHYVCKKNDPTEMVKRYRVRVYFNDANGNKRYVTYQNVPAYANFRYAKGYSTYLDLRPGSTESEWENWIHGNYPEALVNRMLERDPQGFSLAIDTRSAIGVEGDAGDQQDMQVEVPTQNVNSSNWH
jgi:hypothetical protein